MAFNSDHFDLTNWNLGLPVDADGGTAGPALQIADLVGYEHATYFYDAADGAMVFAAPVDGATTSGSKYPRSELREMVGDTRAAWSLSEGGTLSATLEVDRAPLTTDGGAGRVVVGQIHGQSEELVRLIWEDGTLYFINDRAGAEGVETEFQLRDASGATPKVGLNERFSYVIDAHQDTLTVRVLADGREYVSTTTINSAWQADSFYFKAGAYVGVNETQGTGWGQTSFYDLSFTHAPPVGPPARTVGGAGADTLTGAAGVDLMYGMGGADRLVGAAGDDRLDGGAGADVLLAGDGADRLYGGDDSDRLYGDRGDDRLYGGAGDDFLFGGDDADGLYGEAGNDRLDGGAGRDVLDGGAGTDRLTGGADIDRFTFQGDWGRDVVVDFQTGADQLDLRGAELSYADLRWTRADLDGDGARDDLRIDVNHAGFGVVLLLDVGLDRLSASDLIL